MNTKTIKQLIKNYNTDQLQELILTIVSGNPSAQQTLLDYCQKNGVSPETDEYAIIIENQLKHHWARASEIIDEFDMYGGGPEEEEEIAYNELEEMIEILESEETPWEPRREILEDVLVFIRSNNSGFSDMLMDLAFPYAGRKRKSSISRTSCQHIGILILVGWHLRYIVNVERMQNIWKAKRRIYAMPRIIWS